MRLLLASAPHADTFGYSMPPPGLLRLGGWLRERGTEVRLEDLAHRLAAGNLPEGDGLGTASARLLLARIDAAGPWCLGLSTMGATLPIALVIAREVRDLAPDLPILLGGPGVSAVDREVLERFPFIDAVLRGEGELPLAELFGEERRGPTLDFAGLAGFTWRDAAGAIHREPDARPLDDLDQVAPPAWDLLPPLADYKAITGSTDGLVPVDSGRGCSFDCSFCSIPRFWSRRSRCLSPERLCDELDALRHLDGARSAYLCHDIFGANRANAWDLCNELLARAERTGRAPLPWEVRARIDHLDPELIERMGAAGCYRVLLGIESASAAVRQRASKNLHAAEDPAVMLERIAALGQAGIMPILSLILGLPGEDEADLRATLDLCLEASLRAPAQLSLHLVNPQPGCALGEDEAAASRPVEGIAPDMALGAGLGAPERALIDAHPTLFSTWSLLTAQPGGEAHLAELASIAKSLPALLMRFPRSVAVWRDLTGEDPLDAWRRTRAEGISFEGLARARRDDLLDDTLAWEQAKVRAAARGPGAGRALGPGCDFELCAELLELGHDLTELDAWLTHGGDRPAPHPGTYAISAGEAGVLTQRLAPDLVRLLRLLQLEEDEAAPALRELGVSREELLDHLTGLEAGTLLRRRPAPQGGSPTVPPR
ncbi:MAG: radical SAM protein [Planctomycetota bacterium]|nr:radical SAM protein [Planctomycetota bacterium]